MKGQPLPSFYKEQPNPIFVQTLIYIIMEQPQLLYVWACTRCELPMSQESRDHSDLCTQCQYDDQDLLDHEFEQNLGY